MSDEARSGSRYLYAPFDAANARIELMDKRIAGGKGLTKHK